LLRVILCYSFSVNIFYLDIASKDGTLACVTPQKVLALRPLDTKISDAQLVPLIQDVWKEAGWTPSDITQIACVLGPGGFMSLRVGVATANALAWGLKIPSCGVYQWNLWSARSKDASAVWIHSTKKQEVFVRLPDAQESVHVSLDDALKMLPSGSSWMGELLPEHVDALKERGHERAEVRPLQDVLPSFLGAREYAEQTLMPWYGREG
jgi:tRNA threonylcarbamoyl adenosine modification protein YeaZ